MTRLLPKLRLSAAAIAVLTVGMIGAASAAPVAGTAQSVAQAAAHSQATQVYWMYRHHHRMWVPDRRRHR